MAVRLVNSAVVARCVIAQKRVGRYLSLRRKVAVLWLPLLITNAQYSNSFSLLQRPMRQRAVRVKGAHSVRRAASSAVLEWKHQRVPRPSTGLRR